ncbi:MAG: chromosome segregation protein SMC [Anaerolineaceae bacterium]|nr:chromosome segregation protein SMC [Anaerolineaceae bacterium]
MIRRLNSLELQGFKTFATSTRLEFPGQITAIVGPNGSGKSNIADSIRWALGEQSYSLLRAKKTEDMIFSGSQHRPRAGMAAVTINFNNEDGWLPIDYAEVSLSRRAYRDGQNEYLLNGQKVRLKDISELLAQTGLAEMSYTIIGQGLVDVALALKPDERRKLFEEAAGIGLYQSRKAEALKRLENTRKNLDRVLDIMTEIKPRLRSLERQSARFTEYQSLRADLQVLLREWYGFHWHQKQDDLRNARSAYKNHEHQLSAMRRQHAELSHQVEESRNTLQEKRHALELAHKTLSELHRDFEKSSRELAILEERRRSYKQQQQDIEIDLANVEEALTGLETQELGFTEEIEQRTAEYNAALDEVNQVETKLAEVKRQKENEEALLSETRKKRIRLETENLQLKARLEELHNRLQSQALERNKAEASLAALKEESVALKGKTEEAEKAHKAAEKNLEKQNESLKAKRALLDELEVKRQSETDKLASLNATKAKLQAQFDVLQQAEAALSGYSEGSKAILEDSRKGHLPKGIEPLSQHLIVDAKYEKALSAALGELADLLVVPSDARDMVIAYLESKEQDRVALVADSAADKSSIAKAILSSKGVIGLASDLVQVDERYASIAKAILSQLVIVEDQSAAQAILPELKNGQKVVTLNGLVFHTNGIITSGQGATAKRMGRTRQKGELEAEIHAIDDKIRGQETNLAKLNSELEKNRQQYQAFTQSVEQAESEQKDAYRARQKLLDEYSRYEEQINWHTDRLEALDGSETDIRAQIEQHQQKCEDLEIQAAELMDAEETYQENVNAVPVFDVQQELNQWQTHQIVAKNALGSARQRAQDHKGRLDDAKERLALYRQRIGMIQSGLKDIQEQEVLLKADIDQDSANIAEIEKTQIDPLTRSQNEVEKSVLDLQRLEDQSHKKVIIAERQYTQLQLELDRRNDQLENLVQKIEDDFGLVAYDYEKRMDGPNPLPFDDGSIENLPVVKEISPNLENDIKQLKAQIRRIGAINPEAQQEYLEVKERHEFMTQQIADLEAASDDLRQVIDELDTLMERDFISTFKAVNVEFSDYFTRLFNGGEAKLVFSDEENPVEGGVDIEARLPGRRQQVLALLSGGERSLTAVALIFALLKVSPTPFCILDEVDAMLDESNVGRFIDLLRDLSQKTQFVIITHNRNTVQAADVIYGVTMGRESTSQMISLKLEEVDEAYLK